MTLKKHNTIAFGSERILSKIRGFFWSLLFFSAFLLLPSQGVAGGRSPKRSTSALQKKKCISLYRRKMFLKAATCFETLGLKMKEGSQLPKLRRFEKGQFLRNAAVSYEKAAVEQAKVKPALSAFLREKAVRVLDLYQQEKLCESAYRCRIVLDLRSRIFKKIGYGQLAVVIDDPKASATVDGFRFHKMSKGDMNIRVRPGTYHIVVLYPNQAPKKATIVLKPHGNVIKTFLPPHRNRTITNTAIGLYITGFVLVAGGGTLLGLGVVNWVEAGNKWMEPLTPLSEKEALEQQRGGAQPMIWGGGGAIGLGVTFLVLGMAFHQPKKKAKWKQRTLQKPPSRSTLFKSDVFRLPFGVAGDADD